MKDSLCCCSFSLWAGLDGRVTTFWLLLYDSARLSRVAGQDAWQQKPTSVTCYLRLLEGHDEGLERPREAKKTMSPYGM